MYPFNHRGLEADTSAFEHCIDLQKIYEEGFFSTKISDSFSRRMLAAAKSFDYKPYYMDSIDHGGASDYNFVKKGLPPAYKVVIDSIMTQCAPALAMFDCEESPVFGEIGILKLSEGYYVDWHQDSFSQGIIYFCAILNEIDFEENDGGVLQFSKVKFGGDGEICGREIKGEFPANNSGQIVFFDPSNLNFQHRCTKIKTDKTRYLFFGAIGEIM